MNSTVSMHPKQDEPSTVQPSSEEQQRKALADMIERNAAAIESRWLELAIADVALSPDVSMTDFRNAVRDYLVQLAKAIRQGDEFKDTARGGSLWVEVAKEHSITRVRLGFDIEQLVHEFTLLRRVLVDFARREGLLSDSHQVDRMADYIEAAIAVAVKSYVTFRDYEIRKKEAEHVGFITHELRNPLTVATINLTELSRRLPPSEDLEKSCNRLKNSLQRLKELIDTVLVTEELEAGLLQVRPKETNLGAVVEESTRAATAAAKDKGLHLQLEYDATVPLNVDPTLTISALSNLVDNAVKYTDSGSIGVQIENKQKEIVVHVRDTCDGISDEELKTIFEPFRRGHSHTTKPGSGLGLSIAKRAVEAQGGQLHAESSTEEGCHFWFTLPKVIRKAG